MLDNPLRDEIFNQVKSASGGISNIIYNTIQSLLKYNENNNSFEMDRSELDSRTEYFKDHPEKIDGRIEGTNIFWKLTPKKFIVYLF